MSYIKQCNICGKFEGEKGTKFSGNELSLNIPGYKGKNYNLYMLFGLIYEEDEKKMLKAKEKLKNLDLEDILKKNFRNESDEELDDLKHIKLEEPEPLICDKCKKGIAYLMWQYGVVGKPIKF